MTTRTLSLDAKSLACEETVDDGPSNRFTDLDGFFRGGVIDNEENSSLTGTGMIKRVTLAILIVQNCAGERRTDN